MMMSSAPVSPRYPEGSDLPLFAGMQALVDGPLEELDMAFGVPFADEDIDTCQQVLAVERSARKGDLTGCPLRPLRVVLVDDNGLVAKLLAVLLRLDGHDVRIAGSGLEALQCVRSYRPHVVLLDINLPDMSGYEVASHLRARDDTKRIFLAAVTGYGRKEDGEQYREAGFDCHLVKPVDAADLRRLLAKVANGGKEVF